MKLCDNNCTPCCDYCKYVVHDKIDDIKAEPILCNKYNDKYHNEIAERCGYCNDFHCEFAE